MSLALCDVARLHVIRCFGFFTHNSGMLLWFNDKRESRVIRAEPCFESAERVTLCSGSLGADATDWRVQGESHFLLRVLMG